MILQVTSSDGTQWFEDVSRCVLGPDGTVHYKIRTEVNFHTSRVLMPSAYRRVSVLSDGGEELTFRYSPFPTKPRVTHGSASE